MDNLHRMNGDRMRQGILIVMERSHLMDGEGALRYMETSYKIDGLKQNYLSCQDYPTFFPRAVVVEGVRSPSPKVNSLSAPSATSY